MQASELGGESFGAHNNHGKERDLYDLPHASRRTSERMPEMQHDLSYSTTVFSSSHQSVRSPEVHHHVQQSLASSKERRPFGTPQCMDTRDRAADETPRYEQAQNEHR